MDAALMPAATRVIPTTPRFEVVPNDREGMAACDVDRLAEADGTERQVDAR
jgi:hypothetical protein